MSTSTNDTKNVIEGDINAIVQRMREDIYISACIEAANVIEQYTIDGIKDHEIRSKKIDQNVSHIIDMGSDEQTFIYDENAPCDLSIKPDECFLDDAKDKMLCTAIRVFSPSTLVLWENTSLPKHNRRRVVIKEMG